MIHRTINGLPDDLYRTTPANYNVSGYFYTPVISDNPCSFLYRSVGYYPDPDNKVNQDSEPDEFQFNFLGKQGTFIIPKNSSFTGGPVKVLTKPQSNLDVQLYQTAMPFGIKTDLGKIVITDDNGIQYWFTELQTTIKKKSKVISDSSKFIPNIGTEKFYHYEYDLVFDYYVTDWALTKIIDLNSKEEINLEYEYFFAQIKSPEVLTSYISSSTRDYYWDDKNMLKGDQKRLKSISFSNGDKVNFEYSTQSRCDSIWDKALQKIRIKNNSGNEIEYGLNYVYYKGNTEINFDACVSQTEDESLSKWLFLKSITKNASSSSIKIAEFDYIRSSDKIAPNTPANSSHVRKNVRYQDFFGYYKGSPVKNCYDPNGVNGICLTTPLAGYSEIGSLKKIIYPTGGSSTFEYEGNSIVENGAEKPFYGVRIKRSLKMMV
ncbi:MAG: hypothetical protein IPJ81_17465 [Chitinophagaceae bacterium]|nr:hypothetical protein [Chitinophagaceae bacterium]